jgi:hypothetical protein
MTRISERKTTLKFETSAVDGGRALVVKVTAHEAIIWQKGRRIASAYSVPWRAAFQLGAKLKEQQRRIIKLDQKKKTKSVGRAW